MNVVFSDISDQLDKNDAMITSLQDEKSRKVPNVRRPKRHATIHVNKLVDENEDEEAKEFNHTSFNQDDRRFR